MEKTDKPIITWYKYIERLHIQQFIQDRIQNNLDAFMHESSHPNDYQGISISGGSGTGKTQHGFEAINIVKDLDKIHNYNFEVIHMFVQIFTESSFIHFDKCPPCDPSTRHYPHNPTHVGLSHSLESEKPCDILF